MSKNMTNEIFSKVSKMNRNSVSASIKALKESEEIIEDEVVETEDDFPYDNTTEKFCPRCGVTYTDYPALSRYDNKTYICPDCGVEEAMINYTGGKLTDPNVVKQEPKEETEDINEEVNIDTPSNEELEKDEEDAKIKDKKEIEDRLGSLRQAIQDGVSDDEKEEMEKEIAELENELNESAKVLTEAPEDEEEIPVEETEEEVIEEPTEDIPTEDEEMTDEEYQDEVEEDKEDTIEDDVEEPFYATMPEFDELRDLLVDLDYRLFLINDNMVCIGRLNGPDIELLTSNRPENTQAEVSEENEKAEEIEVKAEEDGEQAFEYKWIKAPETLEELLNQVNVVYLSPDMSDEDKEQYAGIEASHESVMNFLMNELPEDKQEEKEEEEIEDTLEDISEEEPTEEVDENIDEESVEETEEEEEE